MLKANQISLVPSVPASAPCSKSLVSVEETRVEILCTPASPKKSKTSKKKWKKTLASSTLGAVCFQDQVDSLNL